MAEEEKCVSTRNDGCSSGGKGYHPSYLAAKHRISVQQARDLLAEVGHDRERLNVVANVVRIASGR